MCVCVCFITAIDVRKKKGLHRRVSCTNFNAVENKLLESCYQERESAQKSQTAHREKQLLLGSCRQVSIHSDRSPNEQIVFQLLNCSDQSLVLLLSTLRIRGHSSWCPRDWQPRGADDSSLLLCSAVQPSLEELATFA